MEDTIGSTKGILLLKLTAFSIEGVADSRPMAGGVPGEGLL